MTGQNDSLPVRLAPIAALLDIEVAPDCIPWQDNALAVLLGRRVYMRPRLRRSVQRWALAHEIGHHLANHPQPCLYDPAAVSTADERAANAFAANLLLPRRWLVSSARATRLQSPVQQIRTLSRIFVVPEPRMTTALRNLLAEGVLS